MKNKIPILIALTTIVILVALPTSTFAFPFNIKRDSPFPLFSVGASGLAFRLEDSYLRDVIGYDHEGFFFGYQLDAEVKVFSSERVAAYMMVNFSFPRESIEVKISTVEGLTGESFDVVYQPLYRNVGTRFVLGTVENSRVWIEGGGAFLDWKTSLDSEEIYSMLIHGWFVGVGIATPIRRFVSLYSRIAFTSVPHYTSDYMDSFSSGTSSRYEYGGWSFALGIRFDL